MIKHSYFRFDEFSDGCFVCAHYFNKNIFSKERAKSLLKDKDLRFQYLIDIDVEARDLMEHKQDWWGTVMFH